MHRDYIKEHRPVLYNQPCLSGELWAYLADLNEQAQSRFELIKSSGKRRQNIHIHYDGIGFIPLNELTKQ